MHTKGSAVAEGVVVNDSSAVADAVDLNVSSAVAGSKSGPLTRAQRNEQNTKERRKEYYERIAWDSSMYTEDEYRQWYGIIHSTPLYECTENTALINL